MPCSDGRTDYDIYHEANEELKQNLDEVTELLCYVLGNINNDAWYNGVTFRYAQDRDPWDKLEVPLMEWWTEHKRLDNEARIAHLEENARERRKFLIMQKLKENFGEEEIEELKELL